MRLTGVLTSVALAMMSACVAAPAVQGQQTARSEFAVEADAIMEAAYRADAPGAAAIVMRGGEVIWSGARGLADVQAGKPITEATAFRMGSITKQFTAVVILQLVAEGKLSLDDPLAQFFPGWPDPGGRATIRQLLNHTSGIPEFTSVPGYMLSEPTMRPVTTADLLAVIRSRPSASEPGAVWRYNNSGYVVLGAIIEQLTGKPWHDAVRERVTRQLGLTSIVYGPADQGDPALALPFSAQDGRFVPSRGVHLSVGHAAGSLVGSVTDFAEWTQALHHGSLVRSDLYTLMTSPAPLANDETAPYGFGLHLIEFLGQPGYRHGGAARGVDTGSIYIPSHDLFVAVFANSDSLPTDSSITVRRLAALAMGRPYPNLIRTNVPAAAIAPLFGTYRADSGPDFHFSSRDGKLYFGRGTDDDEVVAAGDDRFFFGPDELTWVSFERQSTQVLSLVMHREDGVEVRATRAGAVSPKIEVPAETLRSYVGIYATEGPRLTIALDGDGRLTLAAGQETPEPLRARSETEFVLEARPLSVTFHPENGRTDKLTLSFGPREFHGTRTEQ